MFKAIVFIAAVLLPWAAQAQQMVKCVGKDGKTYFGSTLPPQCAAYTRPAVETQELTVRAAADAMVYLAGHPGEGHYLMHAIDRWVTRTALQTMARRRGGAREGETCIINLSGASILIMARS